MEAMVSTQIPAQEVNLELEQAAYAGSDFTFLWLEITRKCNLSCVHCYAESATSGLLTKAMWQSVIDQAQQMGVKHVQFVGGEPTIHPDFPDLLVRAAQRGMSIEVYSNLTHIKPPLWGLFIEFFRTD
jgi:MoaA/NifB/PqqE/SkfB family radical SAM enzyme